MITDEHIRLFTRFLCLCENDSGSPEVDYRAVYRYKDGNGGRRQVTLGMGFTEDGGNLGKVLDAYFANGGTSAELKSKRGQVGKGALAADQAFCSALSKAGAESPMKRAQDKVFKDAYLGPAIAWAEREGFTLPLSYAIAVDSFLHSGRMSPHLRDKFSEPTPRNGGNEQIWMRSYCTQRMAWFKRSAGPLGTCVFRPKFFLEQMKANNWGFSCPLRIAEKGKIC
jgi:hypothetical protein